MNDPTKMSIPELQAETTRLRDLLSEARADIMAWDSSHGCCAGRSDDLLAKIRAALGEEPAGTPPSTERMTKEQWLAAQKVKRESESQEAARCLDEYRRTHANPWA
jgi:hypothetical protein